MLTLGAKRGRAQHNSACRYEQSFASHCLASSSI
jgi:hypothetical protein